MAEQLGLEERFGQARAIDGDERLVRALTQPVNCLRDKLLARTTFASHEHFRVRSSDALDLLHEVEHLRAAADELR